MRDATTPGEVDSGQATLILADITGYTRFLSGVSDTHATPMGSGETPPAYPLMTTLLDSIVHNLAPPFALAKLEGDAVFAIANDGTLDVRGDAVTDCLHSCYATFREQLRQTEDALTCSCDACVSVMSLDLKFVLHHGAHVRQSIAGSVELLGPDVTTAHRMLKNQVTATTGWSAHALVPDAAAAYLGLADDGAKRFRLDYEHVGTFEALAIPLGLPG